MLLMLNQIMRERERRSLYTIRLYENKIANNIKTDPKLYYRYARSKMDVKDGIGPLTDEDGNVISDNKDMAQVLNQYFTTVFTDENMDNIPESRCLCRDENILKGVDVSYEAVLKKLEETDPEKARKSTRRRQHPSGHTTKTGSTTSQAAKHDVYQKSEIWSSAPRLETGKRDSYI